MMLVCHELDLSRLISRCHRRLSFSLCMSIFIIKLIEHYIIVVGRNFIQNTRSLVLNVHVSVKDKSDDAKGQVL
jgi:hypothetical protein